MTLVEAKPAGMIYADLIPEREVSGGSAANTVAAIASLGGTPAFIGKVHDDELGQEFQRSIGAAGVDFFTKPLLQGPSTGRSIVLVTPDAERSMFTYLGAAQKLSKEDIDENIIKSSRIIYLEGYAWDSETARAAMLKACELAHKYERMIAFSLSDRCCIDRHREDFLRLITDHVDIIFGNEEEIKALYEEEDFYKCLDLIKDQVEIAAITRNAKGSVIVNRRIKICGSRKSRRRCRYNRRWRLVCRRFPLWLHPRPQPWQLCNDWRHRCCGNHQSLRRQSRSIAARLCTQSPPQLWEVFFIKKLHPKYRIFLKIKFKLLW